MRRGCCRCLVSVCVCACASFCTPHLAVCPPRVGAQQIHAEDEETLQRFMQAPGAEAQPQQLRLADLIMEKITEKQTELASQMSEMAKPEASLDPKIVKVFTR